MQEELVIAIGGKCFPQLLQRPFSRRMFSDVEMYESSGSDLECDKYIKDTEACGNGDKEIASDEPVRMVVEKG